MTWLLLISLHFVLAIHWLHHFSSKFLRWLQISQQLTKCLQKIIVSSPLLWRYILNMASLSALPIGVARHYVWFWLAAIRLFDVHRYGCMSLFQLCYEWYMYAYIQRIVNVWRIFAVIYAIHWSAIFCSAYVCVYHLWTLATVVSWTYHIHASTLFRSNLSFHLCWTEVKKRVCVCVCARMF